MSHCCCCLVNSVLIVLLTALIIALYILCVVCPLLFVEFSVMCLFEYGVLLFVLCIKKRKEHFYVETETTDSMEYSARL
jgi:hypothetical protein